MEFDVKFENGSYKIKNGRNLCLEFEFIEDEDEDEHDDGTVLYISKIFKCSDDSKHNTREVIKLIETMAKSIPAPPWSRVKYIKLEDGSSINVCAGQNSSGMNIDLRYLKILTTGESWYNSFGYKSANHDANVAHNAVLINKPMHWLLSELFDQEYIKKFKARFPELSTELTVKDYVAAMSKEVPKSGTRTCTKEQEKRARLLFNLVHSIGRSEMLEYDFRLQKEVERGPKTSPKASPKASPKTSPNASPKASPKVSPKASPKPGGGAKRTLRKSRRETRQTRKPIKTRKTRTHKYIKRKTA
jgi:hypothetical protein